jgi:hypothetical protein
MMEDKLHGACRRCDELQLHKIFDLNNSREENTLGAYVQIEGQAM